MGQLRRQGSLASPISAAEPARRDQRGLAAVGRRSPRRCQGTGPAPEEAQPAAAWHRCNSPPAPAEARRLAGLISAARPGMGPRSGVRRRPVPGAFVTARD